MKLQNEIFQTNINRREAIYRKTVLGCFLLIFSILMLLMAVSCNKNDDFGEVNTDGTQYIEGDGVFVLNEGNFGQGNGSLSFLNLDSLKMGNEIFGQANGRPLGDVPLSMLIIDQKGWIVVNNSAKIEVVNLQNLKSLATITLSGSPRFILPVSENKLYVSNFSSGKVFVINSQTYQPEAGILLPGSTENMAMAAGKVFAAFWSDYHFPNLENNRLFVIDPVANTLVDSVIVGKEPNSMVVDNNGKLWVLCSGGFLNEELPSLWRINSENLVVEIFLQFPEINTSPTSLSANFAGDTLYFLNQGIYRMAISDNTLPDTPVIAENEHLFYTLAIHPENSYIFATDAIDYQQRGLVIRYKPDGTFMDSYRAGIIPGRLVFNFISK